MRRAFKAPERRNPMFSSPAEFTRNRELGSGAFATVFDVTHKSSGRRYAMKQINLAALSNLDQENVEKELDIHVSLSHEHVIRLYDFFVEENSVLLILEIAGRGNLFRYMNRKRITEAEVKKFFVQTSLAIDYLHSQGVIMRDLKPENLLLDQDYNIKLCDLGWAARLSDTIYCRAKAGTYAYMSPESLQGLPQEVKTDVWSLGVLLYELSYNKEPYSGNSCHDQLRKIQTTNLNFSLPIDPEAQKLIVSLLKQNANERPGMDFIFNSEYVQTYVKETRAVISRPKTAENHTTEARYTTSTQGGSAYTNTVMHSVNNKQSSTNPVVLHYSNNKDNNPTESTPKNTVQHRLPDFITTPHLTNLSDHAMVRPILYKPRINEQQKHPMEREKQHSNSNTLAVQINSLTGEGVKDGHYIGNNHYYLNTSHQTSLSNQNQPNLPHIKVLPPNASPLRPTTPQNQSNRGGTNLTQYSFNEYGAPYGAIPKNESTASYKLLPESNMQKTELQTSLSNIDAKSTTQYFYRKARRPDNESVISRNNNTSMLDVSPNDSRSFSPNLSPNQQDQKTGFMVPGFRVAFNQQQNRYQTQRMPMGSSNNMPPSNRATFFTNQTPNMRSTSANLRLKSQTDLQKLTTIHHPPFKNKQSNPASYQTQPFENHYISTGGRIQLTPLKNADSERLSDVKGYLPNFLQTEPSKKDDGFLHATPPRLPKSNSSVFINARITHN